MGIYTEWKDAYARETTSYAEQTAGVSDVIPDAAATTYLWGVTCEEAKHPSPKTTMLYNATDVNKQEVTFGNAQKSVMDLMGNYIVGMQNGVLIWYVMGGSTTAGGGPPHTHVVAPPAAVAGVLPPLPSFAIQHERTGTATAWRSQYIGCKMLQLILICGQDQPFLLARMDWIAKKAATVGFALTNNPTLPATESIAAYHFNNMTRTFDGNPVLGLSNMEFKINPDFTVQRGNTWDGATFTGRDLVDLIEGPRKLYTLTMQYSPTSSVIWEELLATGNTKNMVFKWTRSADDYIQMTLTDCNVISHDMVVPISGTELMEEVTVEPLQVSFDIRDSIAVAHYGE